MQTHKHVVFAFWCC